MERIRRKVKKHHILSTFALGAVALAAFNFTRAPLFNSLDRFVLFASDNIQLAHEVQVSSGDFGSNKTIDIQKDAIINGSFFADTIVIGKSTQVNGNVAANRLKLSASSTIFGSTSSSVSLPIANLPQVPAFTVGTQDFTFTGATGTLPAGSYRTITIAPSSTLTLSGGIYRLRALDLKDNATLIFNAPTTLNIQFKLKGKDNISILPGLNLKPDDLKINYLGMRPKNDKTTEDDDGEIASLLDQQETKDLKAGKIGRPIVFGKDAFLNFKLLAPRANVHLKDNTTLRGRVLAKKIEVGRDSILSREDFFSKESDLAQVVEDQNGAKFVINEVIVLFEDGTTLNDFIFVANSFGARPTGFLSTLLMGKLEVSAASIEELDIIINQIRNSEIPTIKDAFSNVIVL
ncbi:MAG: hypothetical protein A2945_03045 [Candidatus Liptonbacteria bacterium RIFCSPLOWO2_01_FULL_52_25]|uniref:Uncharacterized protein n=1 Tax=Candidatus Liptonbacteria bacterium RIFCSPLOWO2_01_FULL_52_25 TaxID=1798650 RepID=A0A1G2CGQ9_9BACT|nr:MAG: hypothetical protein A2945_03045 [Candidatus Liptonbacteria bacterium RIFCSPLOWO2_01_FULL_52_25]